LIARASERQADLMTEVAGLAMDVTLELHARLTVAIADAARAELAAEALRIAATGETGVKKQNSTADKPRVRSLAAIATANIERPGVPLDVVRPVEIDAGRPAKRKKESEFAASLLNLYDRLGGFPQSPGT
jgi:hypothetical protein